jgi:hypothetical protein
MDFSIVSMWDTRFSWWWRFKLRSSGFVTPCSIVVGYQCFRGPCCLHLPSYPICCHHWTGPMLPIQYLPNTLSPLNRFHIIWTVLTQHFVTTEQVPHHLHSTYRTLCHHRTGSTSSAQYLHSSLSPPNRFHIICTVLTQHFVTTKQVP